MRKLPPMSESAEYSRQWRVPCNTSLFCNIVIPLSACLLINGVIFSTGMNADYSVAAKPWFAPPGWFVGAMWVFLYILYGIARWTALHETPPAPMRAALGITGLILWGLAYPFLTLGFDLQISALLNVASLLLTLFVMFIVFKPARRAFWLLVPSALWEAFATVLGFATLANIP